MTDVEDFKGATARLLGKLPGLAAPARQEGPTHPRLEIEAGTRLFIAFAAEPNTLRFFGLEAVAGEVPYRAWQEFAIDPEGYLLTGAERLRVRRMEWDDGGASQPERAWPEFANARKMRRQ